VSWTRREWLAAAATARPKSRHKPPNILLILTGQHYIRAMSAAGNSYLRTPNIDSLAQRGTRFENSWCTSPAGAPARASIVTGCLPHTTGVDYPGQKLNPKVPTLGELFRSAGYETAWAGNWHLPEAYPGARFPNIPPVPPEDRGFDFLRFDVNDKGQEQFGDFTDERIAQAAANFVTKSRTRPFLLGLSLNNPHDICFWVQGSLPKEHPGLREAEIDDRRLPPLPPNFQIPPDEPEFISRCRSLNYSGGPEKGPDTRKWDETHWRRYLHAYYRMVERTDRNIGIVLEEMRRRHQDENTIIVFTSDDGEGMGAHRWVMNLMLYQEPVSVPLIFCWKGWIHANRLERKALASGMDILPTLCDLASVTPPKYMHGASFRPVLESTSGRFRDSVFAELAPAMNDKSLRGCAARTARFKYVAFSWGKNPEMLFDLHADPGEMRNLAGTAEYKDDLAVHRDLAAKWAASDGLPA
jgi:arylsulfatase A-like enzyme